MANISELKTTEIYAQTSERVAIAAANGLKVAHIAKAAGVHYHRLASVAFSGKRTTYGYSCGLTEDECVRINRVIDEVKAAL